MRTLFRLLGPVHKSGTTSSDQLLTVTIDCAYLVIISEFGQFSQFFRSEMEAKVPDRIFVERREEGDFAVRRPNSERASDVLPTQSKAIERARELNPDGPVLVERVRDTQSGGRDKWRRP